MLNYGHPPPLLVRADGEVCFPEPAQYSLPLGLGLGTGEAPSRSRWPSPPATSCSSTRTASRRRATASGAFYPLGARTLLLKDPDPEAALEALRRDLILHTEGPLHDDAAMLLLRYRE